jgi:hypothetical protein
MLRQGARVIEDIRRTRFARCGREPGSSRIAAVRGLPRGPTRDRADGNSQPTPILIMLLAAIGAIGLLLLSWV